MVGEGIETCLAAMQATGNAPGRRFPLGPSVAQSAARCSRRDRARRWRRSRRSGGAGLCATLEARRPTRPDARPPQGMDFNDLLMGRIAEGGDEPDALEPEQLIADAINGAEEITDPLAGLVEKTAVDPGAPLEPEALEALTALKQDNPAAFEAQRAELKKARCRVTALDDAISKENGTPSGRGPTQADILIGLAQTAELFHTSDAPALSTSTSTVIARPGRSALRAFAAGSPGDSQGNRRCAQFGGHAIGAQRNRGEGTFRCAETAGPYPRWWARRPALSRSLR